jgi:hypothetical protein
MIATILQVTGISLVSLGIGLIFPPAGVVVAGIGMVLFGMAIERGTK